uniref:Chromodomain helicase DNA binding protein 7 n=1 Tax=Lepisosteus oculatus TaxID=7918 RepID=W5MCI6_LEPOC|nr:PREDICTED: chromodomain-helicase-DNA-binding protein 7 isoform X1 [Lepisosteus oculatus]XP_015209126.1 PREDICTED: chromodomain-helicase-DNA-binding protein 7 isoform X1 [Lepisosteus oculatus]XP_015209127.1 PREDICTED: chromodomain-helicase-DNA-binding protein 7 isoform X1 [Lepisosteus oculatus]
MADPGMMSLFGDDGNLFTEGLEGLGECGYSESQVNPLGQQMPIDQGYGSLPSSLHHTSQAAPGQGQPKLSHFDHFGQYEQPKMHLIEQQGGRMLGSAPGNGMSSPHSQYHNPPPPVSHGGGGQIGVYPGMQGERHGQPFVDSGSMWGPRAVQVPEQVRAPFQQQQQQAPPQQSGPSGPQGHVQQMGPYMARGDYTMQQHSQTPTPPRMNQFSQGPPQEGSRGPPANHFLGHMAPQQNPNLVGPPMRHSVQPQQPQQFHHRPPPGAILPESVAHSPRFSPSPSQQQQQQAVAGGRPQQNLGFSSRSQPVPSPTVNNSGQYPPYSPYSNLNQGLVNNTGMSPNMSLTSSSAPMNQGPVVPRYPSAGVGYPPGGPQGLMHQQPIHVNQINSQPMHPSQQQQPAPPPQPAPPQQPPPQGSYGSPPPMSPMKAMSNPAGTPPPQQVRPGSAGMGMEVGGYPSMPHQPAGALGLSQRNMGPRGLTQQQQQQPPPPPQPYMGLSPSQRDLAGSLRPPGGLGGGHAEPQVLQDQRLLSGPPQQPPHPGPQLPPPLPFQKQQLQACSPMQQQQPPQQQQQQPQALLSVHRQSSPPHPHHQPWAQQHQSPPTPQKVPVQQPSPSDPSLDLPASDKTHAAGPNSQLATCDEQQAGGDQKQKKKKKKKVKASPGEGGGEAGPEGCVDPLKNPAAEQPEEKKKKKKPKEKKEPKEPKPPKTPKTPKTPKEPKEKKVKTTTPKAKSTPKVSVKKPDPETSTTKKKEGKRKRESSDNSDLEKTPPPSPEEEEDLGVQKRRSSRQVKRKRYTEDLEFKISDEEAEDGDATGQKSPSNASEQQEAPDAEGPVVEKIMGMRMGKKKAESGEEVDIEEFYVKFKNFSYLHCRWADIEELGKDKRVHQKVKRFKAKQSLNNFLSEMDDEPFNPDYVEVDRILDVSQSTDDNGEPVTHYLVKWCSLPYEDSTWELKQDIDSAKIEEFEKLMAREPELNRVERPPASDWQKSESSREYKNGNALREYQLEGVNWLLFNWYNARNCILADEMGLGKTIQSITFLYEIFLKGIHGPFLVIAPLSTIPNWEREFHTWTELNVVVYHGSQASRRTIQTYEMNFRDPQGRVIKGAYKFHAVITTFEMILTDCPELRNIQWRCVVIDEAHRLKNRNCKLLEGLKMMDMEHKVLLTGTPLQNTVEELFSLLNFLEPERFPSESTFMQEFGDLKTEEQVQKLQGILKPMMLRRLKEDVEKNLAPKEETIIEVELTNIQKKYYRAILEKNFAFLSKGGGGGGNANVPNLLNTMMELRKCCNHPYLINGAEEKILEEFRETHHSDYPDFHLQAMIQAAGKLVLIDKLLPKLKAGGHRVLVFSQMVRCLDILEDYLIQRRYPYERIDGRVRGNLRQAAIDRFSRPDSDRFVFLLCTRAGGLGINLTAADTCIIFDSDWNPQNDLQAQARCHRIGQSKAVKIYRLITRNSYEREMFDKASLKLGLDKAVLQSMSGRENAANGVQQLSKKEIEDLLRKGAYGALMDEEDEGSKFCEEDIDQILQRRTQTITIESEGKGSTFAKASFVSSGNRTDISLEDPDFWQKWAKKAELDMDAINGRNNLVIDTPRIRKQTRHYSSVKEEEMMEFSELESDSEEKPNVKLRRPQDKSQGYPRSECFRVEKNLLVYGWGRWTDILSHGRFKRQLKEQDVETICRAVLVYCLNHYKGDENIKSFIWDLITPTEDGQTRALQNHSGLSAPVPRGRKGKKVKTQAAQPFIQQADWLASCNPDTLFQEDSYKKHLKHHCNKVLLRVRMLYYLRQEVIGDQADKILEGTDSSEIDVWIPQPFHAEVPTDWWNREADKSLLIGVFKHGYEKYNSMRADPSLYFLERVGMPDAKAIAAEQRGADMMADGADGGDFDREDEDPEYKPARMPFKDEMDEFANSPLDDKEEAMDVENSGKSSENAEYGKLYWPTASALTTRLRRLITAYQRSYKREQMRQEALNKTDRRRRRPREEVRALEAEREAIITERRQKWTRREEADFYRVVSTFGVMFDTKKHRFDWNQFRAFARLDKKTDESLEKYFYSFVAMCRRVCRMPVKSDEEPHDPTILIEPITEERASRTLYRIELLRKIREQVLTHPDLDERLKLCQASLDLPEWWESGRHDKDLLVGASKHGVSRTDYHILNDPELSFLESHRRFAQNKSSGQLCSTPYPGQGTLLALSAAALPVKKEEEQEPHPPPAEGAEALEEEPKAEVDPLKASEEEEAKEDVRTSAGEEVPVKPEESEGAPTETQCDAKEPAVQEDAEALAELEPKSLSEKGSEEDDEDKMDDDDKSEESSHAEAGAASRGKNFDEESNASMSTARDETRDGFYAEDGETSMAHILHERSFSFSFWPKDRVMINRLDNICEAVLKGKWPVNRRQLFDFPGLLPGYTPSTLDSPLPRRSFAELSMVGQANYSGSEDITLSPQISKEEVLSMTVPRQRRRRRRKIEIEAERAAKRKNLMEMVAQLRESHVGSDSPDKAVDLSKALREATSSTSNISSVASKFLLPNASTPTADAFKTQMELLQAGLSGTPTRQLMNGSFLEGEIPMKRRRGRRKNVEGLDLLFMSNKRASLSAEDAEVTKAFEDRVQVPQQPQRNIPSPGQLDPNARIPVINLEDGSRLVGDEAPTNKDLIEWLKQHPAYTVDMPSYVPKNEDLLLSPFQKPKQKRHRCRNPNKIDINTLTGEERVPVVNRRNGKKMGGAMAPPMKDLPRWLEENPEFAIAPDWTEIVKQSGFLPESMYDRLLTGPVVREEGPGRRGRRPKSEIAKAAAQAAAAAASSSGINPLLMNSLFAGMDLTSLQNLQNLQSLQLAGLMGFPPGLATGAGGDAKHTSAMLPLMLPGMAGLPNMFGLGGLFNNNLAAAAAAASGSPSAAGQGEPEEGAAPKPEENNDEEGDEKESEKAEASGEGEGSASAASAAAAAAAAAGMSAGPLAFNPFLLSTMAPGLFYPSMFLPPSLGGLTLPGFSQATLAGLQNAMAGASGGAAGEEKEAGKEPAPDAKAEDGDNTMEDSDTDESQNKTADSSVLEDEVGPAEELDSLDGGEDGEENENDD